MLLLGVLLPLISNALYNFGLSPIPRHDISPAVLCLSGVIVAWGLFRYRLFDIMPVAEDTVLDGMDDGVIVLDMGRRIVDLNQAAQRMLGQPAVTAIGQPLDRAFSAWPDLLELSRDAAARRCESTLGVGAGQRQYSLHGLPLVDRRGRPVGRLIVFRDITDDEKAEARLLEQGAALAALEERGRLARELHDGLGQVLGYVNVQTQATRELLASGRIVEADAYLERMAAVAQDAQADVRESILDLRVDLTPGQGLLPILEQCLARFERYYGIRTEMVVRDEAAAGIIEPGIAVQLLRILQEALSNVRKHAHARNVRLTFSARAGEMEVVVEDDGRGSDLTAHAAALAGFGDQDSAGAHLGLRFMRERAESVGGVFQASSTPGQGMKVIVRVPLWPPSLDPSRPIRGERGTRPPSGRSEERHP